MEEEVGLTKSGRIFIVECFLGELFAIFMRICDALAFSSLHLPHVCILYIHTHFLLQKEEEKYYQSSTVSFFGCAIASSSSSLYSISEYPFPPFLHHTYIKREGGGGKKNDDEIKKSSTHSTHFYIYFRMYMQA